MTEHNHTMTPWRFRKGQVWAGNDIDGPPVALVYRPHESFGGSMEANGLLMAAAPELLASLKAIVPYTDGSCGFYDDEDHDQAVEAARAAIAKAIGTEEGGSP